MNGLNSYVYGVILTVLLLAGYKIYSYVDDMKTQRDTLQISLDKTKTLYNNCSLKFALQIANNKHLKTKIQDANKKTLFLAKEYEESNKKYKEMINKPSKIKYRYVNKFIDREVESNECKDIKTAIDNSVDYINDRMQ